MEHAAAQLGRIEVQASLGHDVDQVHRQQTAQAGMLQGVGCAVVEGRAGGGAVEAVLAVAGAAGDRRQGDERVGGAPLAQVHLDRLQVPAVAEAAGDEVQREALQGPGGGQGLAHRAAMAEQLGPIGPGGGKAAALVGLPVRPAQHLLVAGEQFHRARPGGAGVDRALHTRRAERLSPLQPGLRQRPLLGHQLPPARRRHRQLLQGLAQQPAPFSSPVLRQLQRRQRQAGIALTAEALVQFHHQLLQLGVGLPQLGTGLGQVVQAVHQGAAGGMGHAAAREQLAATRLAPPVGQGRVAAQQRHLQPFAQLPFQVAHHKAADEAAARAQQFADPAEQGRALQQLGGERPVGGVVGVEQVQAAAGVGGGHARQQLQHRIHHQFAEGFAAGVHHANAGVTQAHQREQLALLVVVGAGHQFHLAALQRQRGHQQHVHIRRRLGVQPPPVRL